MGNGYENAGSTLPLEVRMSYCITVESMKKDSAANRSKSYQDVQRGLLAFNASLETLPEEKKLQAFDSEGMRSIIESCDKYIKSHHPLTKAGKERLQEMKQLRDNLRELSNVGHMINSYDNFVREKVTYPYNTAQIKGARMSEKDAADLAFAQQVVGDDLSTKLREMSFSISNAEHAWGGSERFGKVISDRVAAQQNLKEMLNEQPAPVRREETRVKTSLNEMMAATSSGSRVRKAPEPVKEAMEKKGRTMGR